ncbi:hypothetical protein [Micromonospora sp. CPCC 206061]|uniref:hypothetical protein n=1 Tax=Micromonospora sp. CPCC 206061 TaxID=3122410 RepID=UPI002FF1CA5D
MLRATLLAVAAYPLAGCDVFESEPEPAASPDPLAPLLAATLDLAARHEAAIAAYPALADRLTPVLEAHRQHATELAKVTGAASASPAAPAASASAAPAGDATATLAALRTAEQQGQKAAADACLAAPAARAALLGSISAARATHLEVVR